jgi:metal-responsive CopG/Arc/MetJ family transcriptional regulator
MADDDATIRETISLPQKLWKRIEDFQFSARVKRNTEAVRRPIELGLQAHEQQSRKEKADG